MGNFTLLLLLGLALFIGDYLGTIVLLVILALYQAYMHTIKQMGERSK